LTPPFDDGVKLSSAINPWTEVKDSQLQVLLPRQGDNDGFCTRAALLRHAENDFDEFWPDLDTLDEPPNQGSAAMPVTVCQLRPNGSRKLTKSARCLS
jgi:hypothetical protein